MVSVALRCRRAASFLGFALLASFGASLTASDSRQAAPPPPAQSVAAPAKVLFMCPHGAAKSVLASAYFKRLAKERGLNVRVDAAGLEPDPAVGPAVAAHLTKNGYDIPITKPRLVTPDDLAAADIVISLGCDLSRLPAPSGRLQKWDDVPGPSENFSASDEAIRRHVEDLVDELVRLRDAKP